MDVAPDVPDLPKRGSDMTKTIIAMLLAFSATPALAKSPEFITSTVQTADLDLSSSAGQRALDHRLSQAAKEVCGVASDADLEGKNDVRKCRAETLASVANERDQRIAAASSQPIKVAAR
jgi:UrcA family protein